MYRIYREILSSDQFWLKVVCFRRNLGLISGSLPEDQGVFTCMRESWQYVSGLVRSNAPEAFIIPAKGQLGPYQTLSIFIDSQPTVQCDHIAWLI